MPPSISDKYLIKVEMQRQNFEQTRDIKFHYELNTFAWVVRIGIPLDKCV
jgi:hypothetical protein